VQLVIADLLIKKPALCGLWLKQFSPLTKMRFTFNIATNFIEKRLISTFFATIKGGQFSGGPTYGVSLRNPASARIGAFIPTWQVYRARGSPSRRTSCHQRGVA
jgi:hypothetical protein